MSLKTFQLFIAWVSWRPFSHLNLHQNDHFNWVCWLLRLLKQKTTFRVNIQKIAFFKPPKPSLNRPKPSFFSLAFSQVPALRRCLAARFGATAARERCCVWRVVPLWWYDGACCQMLRPKVLDVVNSVAWPWRTGSSWEELLSCWDLGEIPWNHWFFFLGDTLSVCSVLLPVSHHYLSKGMVTGIFNGYLSSPGGLGVCVRRGMRARACSSSTVEEVDSERVCRHEDRNSKKAISGKNGPRIVIIVSKFSKYLETSRCDPQLTPQKHPTRSWTNIFALENFVALGGGCDVRSPEHGGRSCISVAWRWRRSAAGVMRFLNVVVSNIFFTPTWGNDPILLIFFEWVETTN